MRRKQVKSWKRIQTEWGACERCVLGLRATNHVLGRGSIPADVMFVGEAPGHAENATGEPFVGRAGRLLSRAVEEAGWSNTVRQFVTNLVACRPCDTRGGPNRPPEPEEVEACSRRLSFTIRLVRPQIIVTLGRLAERRLPQVLAGLDPEYAPLLVVERHPAYILRQGGEKSSMFAALIVTLREVESAIDHRKQSCRFLNGEVDEGEEDSESGD